MLARRDPVLDEIKSIICSSFPDAEISMLHNPGDHAGGMLYVTNVPEEFDDKFRKKMNFVAVALHKKRDNSEYIVVPIEYHED